MQKPSWLELKKELGEGGNHLPALDKLSDKQLVALTELLREGKKNQRSALNAAMESALGHVPMLLRGAVRKVMFG
jgi:uncharacterized protein YbaP (TraB family)